MVVPVVFPVITAKLGKISVEWPGWVWNQEVNILVWVPLLHESESNSEGTSSGEGLGSSDSAFIELLAVVTVGGFQRLVDVRLNTVDWLVLVIHVFLKDDLLGLSNAGKYVGLSIVISEGSKTEEHLLRVGVALECLAKTEDRVCWCSFKATPGRESCGSLMDQNTMSAVDKPA